MLVDRHDHTCSEWYPPSHAIAHTEYVGRRRMLVRSGGAVLAFFTLLVLSAYILHTFQADLYQTDSRASLSQHHTHNSTSTTASSSSSASSTYSVPPLSEYRLLWSDEFEQPDGTFPLDSN